MPDDTTAAIQALIQQVAALTETVQKQDALIKGVRDHNVRLLDEVKDAKRAKPAPTIFDTLEQERRDRAAANANLVRNADGSLRLASAAGDTAHAVVLTREQARNAATYRGKPAHRQKPVACPCASRMTAKTQRCGTTTSPQSCQPRPSPSTTDMR